MRTPQAHDNGIVAILDALGAASYTVTEIDRFVESRTVVLEQLNEKAEGVLGEIRVEMIKTFTFNDTVLVILNKGSESPTLRRISQFFMIMRKFLVDSPTRLALIILAVTSEEQHCITNCVTETHVGQQPSTPQQARLNTLGRALLWAPFVFCGLAAMGGAVNSQALLDSPWLRGLVAAIPLTLLMMLHGSVGLPPNPAPLSFHLVTNGCLVVLFCLNFVQSIQLRQYAEFVAAGVAVVVVTIPVSVLRLGKKTFQSMEKLVKLPLVSVPDSRLIACHLSDSHVTKDECISVEGNRNCWRNFVSAVNQLGELQPRFLFCTGDLTDSGQAEEWNAVMNQLATLKGTKVFLIPGNHDLNTVYAQEVAINSAILFERFIINASKLVEDLEMHDGKTLSKVLADFQDSFADRVETLSRKLQVAEIRKRRISNKDKPLTMSELEQLHQQDWRRWAGPAERRVRETFFGAGRDWFPLMYRDPAQQTCVVILNSVPFSWTLGEGALGEWGGLQLERLRLILSRLGKIRSLWILTHHAPFRRWDDSIARLQDCWQYGLLSHQVAEARTLTNYLTDFAVRNPNTEVSVLCGHRHKRDAGLCGTIKVFESDALGINEQAGWVFSVTDDRTYARTR
jgi:Calcineurin-like phosphoesterase